MPLPSLPTTALKPKLLGAFHRQHPHRSRLQCIVKSAQCKAVRLLKWNSQGFDGLEASSLPAISLVWLSHTQPYVRCGSHNVTCIELFHPVLTSRGTDTLIFP